MACPFKRINKKNKTINNINISRNVFISIDKEHLEKNKIFRQKFDKTKSNKVNSFKITKQKNDNNSENNNIIILPKYNINKNINNKLNILELNSLDYKTAIKIDKRNYLQYYWSLMKIKHLLFFTFFYHDDYNLLTFKIILFLMNFCLYMFVDALFFDNDKLHQIYANNGVYKLILQIPQILYSTVISAFIYMLLKLLALSEKDILNIKKENNSFNIHLKAKKAKTCIKIKSIFFIGLSLLCIIFFTYYFSCFCAVYQNTQIILLEDVLGSFALSMIYPFGLNLIPGLFRIPSLNAKNHNKEIWYKFSQLISLI